MLDYGSFYAPKTAASADGTRRIVFAWLTERWCDIADEYNGGCTRNAQRTTNILVHTLLHTTRTYEYMYT